MPLCPSCKVPIQNPDDSLGCDRCNKSYHWPCTKLDNYIIKLHKKNPYKPWRCETCTDKYCKHCDKTFPLTDQDSICCDKCSYWYHLRCTDLTKNDFDTLSEDETTKWLCQKCVNNYCKKCDSSVYHKAKISCCLCSHTYHFSCVNIPKTYKDDKSFTKNWICFNCKPGVFPFFKIDTKKTTWAITN